LPSPEIRDANRDRAGECDGAVDPRTNRCKAYAALWEMPTDLGGDDAPELGRGVVRRKKHLG
jgi:hypothetical protein